MKKLLALILTLMLALPAACLAETSAADGATITVTGSAVVTRSYKSTLDAAAGNSILPDDASVSANVTIVFELM